MAGRPIRALIGVVISVGAVCLLVGPGSAAAGTLTVNIDAQANGGWLSGCNLVGVWGNTNYFAYSQPCNGVQLGMNAPSCCTVPAGTRMGYEINAPAGITINEANVTGTVIGLNDGAGWGGGSYWQGGSDQWVNAPGTDGPFSSSDWGFSMACGRAQCSNAGIIVLNSIQLVASETQGPALGAVGTNNLYDQAGHYVWNPPGDPFPVTLAASDPSGVCSIGAQVDNARLEVSSTPVTSEWQQCPEYTSQPWPGSVDTTSFVPGSGPLSLIVEATNAAGVQSALSETLQVDNIQPTVSFSTPNDPNPSVWVNHAVTVDATSSAGPSGIGGENCSIDGSPATSYPAAGLTVDGNGAHTVSCTAWNNAADPQGYPNSGTSSMTVHIDEAPPTLSFEPQDPSAPTRVVVDASDKESGVAGGSIAIAPAGTHSWTNLRTTFDGQHLIAQVNDAGLSGPYAIRASSCDNVGNCTSSSETLMMPLRIAAVSDVSLARLVAPVVVVRRRVLVGWHWQRIRIDGKLVRARIGGHLTTIRIVIRRNASCAQTRVRTGRHTWRSIRVCRTVRISLREHERVGFGRPVAVHGVLVTNQGVPIGNARVRILTSPSNGLGRFTPAATVRTASDGAWSVTLPPGPSETIEAVYRGSGRILPAAGRVTVSVPARLSLAVSPRAVPWNGQLSFTGHLVGGWIPPDGVALRLLVRYTGSPQATVLLAFRTDHSGAFNISFHFPGGRGKATYPFWVATTATESDYPFAAASSRRVYVTFET